MANLMPLERIQQRIYWIRGQKVMLSPDLGELYGVEPRALVQAVVRNRARSPADFMFRLTSGEIARLKSQIVISKKGRGGVRHAPYAFTEQGVAMPSSEADADIGSTQKLLGLGRKVPLGLEAKATSSVAALYMASSPNCAESGVGDSPCCLADCGSPDRAG